MKNAKIFSLLGLVFMASCAKETSFDKDNQRESQQTMQSISFTASLETNGTKASIDNNTVSWTTGDRITLIPFTTDGTEVSIPSGRIAGAMAMRVTDALVSGGSSTATFTYTPVDETDAEKLEKVDHYMAIFNPDDPTNVNGKIVDPLSDETSISDYLNRERVAVEFPGVSGSTSIQNNDNVQLRIAHNNTPSGALAFKNVYHLIRFQANIPGAAKAVLTANTGGTAVSRARTYIYINSEDQTIETAFAGSGSTAITTLTRDLVAGDNYFALSPGMTIMGGFKVELKSSNDIVLASFTHASDFSTYRNKITTIADFDGRATQYHAVLQSGQTFASSIRTLSGTSSTYNSENNVIQRIVIDTENYSTSSGTNVSTTDVPVWANWDSGTNTLTLSTADSKIYLNANADFTFNRLTALTEIENAEDLDFSNVTSASTCFYYDKSLTSFGDITMPLATNVASFFQGCVALTSVGNITLPNATNVSRFFAPTTIGTSPNNYLANLNTVGDISIPSVENASYMFNGCRALTSINFTDMGSSLANASYMFCYARSLTWISGLASSSISNAAYMFYQCRSLTSVDISGLGGYPTSVESMFEDCQTITAISFPAAFNTKNATSYSYLFRNCYLLAEIRIPSFYMKNAASAYFPIGQLGKDLSGKCTIYYTDLSSDPEAEYNTTDYKSIPGTFGAADKVQYSSL